MAVERPPRACMVAYTFYETDNRVRRYAETLVQCGWSVDAIVLRNPGQGRRHSVSGVNVLRIQDRETNERRKASYLIRLVAFLIRSTVTLALEHVKNPYRVVHVHSIPDFEVFAAIVPKLGGAKVILDIHDIVPELFLSKFNALKGSAFFKLLIFVERLSTAFADHVIIANHIWHQRIVSRSVASRKCTPIMNYPVPAIFDGKRRTRGQDGGFIMLYPGTLSRHQGIDTAIKAVDIVKDRIPALKFHIYGKGTDENLLKALTKGLALHDKVIFFESLPLDKIAEVMANADIGVEPKLKGFFSDEAFSTKILEFMYLGVPVIASDTTVHRYYIGEKYVQYHRAGDPDDLAEAILRVHGDTKLRHELGREGQALAATFSWEVKKHMYLDLVSEFPRKGIQEEKQLWGT